ncbi:MAG: dihydroxyacetone kinase subunit L [Treponema sp.]|jgi:dihydroxyacetone kinase phosphoprotein-dependent L subunit|nr:dihydroxyacetone kinase subunit L [Treponema sp.]
MPSFLDEDAARRMIVYTADKIIGNKALLSEIDGRTGDGDHGIGMALGMRKAKEAVGAAPGSGNVWDVFEKAGKAMLMSMGGASGVIFGSLFMAGARGNEPKKSLSPADFALMMEKSLAAIRERGKAGLGDKTMVDALEPAVKAMKRTEAEGFLPMFEAAVQAAAEGVENTKKYQAKFGRAKSLMERAVGFEDPGAVSVWIIFRSMHEFAREALS